MTICDWRCRNNTT